MFNTSQSPRADASKNTRSGAFLVFLDGCWSQIKVVFLNVNKMHCCFSVYLQYRVYSSPKGATMNQDDATLIKCLSIIKEPRIDRIKKHNLIDILVIAICAVIANADGWEEIEDFANHRIEWFKSFLELPNGVPSHDTFARVFARLDPQRVARGSYSMDFSITF